MQVSEESPAQQAILALLDEAPMKPIHYRLWLLSCGGTLLDGFSIFSLGVALPLIVQEMALQAQTIGLVSAALVFGAMVGAVGGGPAADRLGRRPLMLADMLILAAGAGLSAAAPGPLLLLIGQLLVGIGVGIDMPVGGAYLSELTPKRHRGRMMVAAIACQSIGMLLAAAFILPVLFWTSDPRIWRVFFAVDGGFALLFVCLRLSAPESIRWRLSRGENAGAAKDLGRILPEESARARVLAAEADAAVHHMALVPPSGRPRAMERLFRREYLRRTLLASVPWFLMDIATYGVGLFTPVILQAMYFPGQTRGALAADYADARGSWTIDLFLLVGFLVGLWSVPRFGRIRMQIVGFAGMTLGMLLLLGSTQVFGGPSQHVYLVLSGFILFNLLMNAGPNATTFTLPPELFPTPLRASAGGFAAGVAKLGATLGVFVLPILKSWFGIPAVLGAMAGVSLLGLVTTAVFAYGLPEGMPLESHKRRV